MKAKIAIAVLFFCCASAFAAPTWYRTQRGIGIGNCGPACVAMVASWELDKPISVEQIRNHIGYRYADGRTSFEELESALIWLKIPYLKRMVLSFDDFSFLLHESMCIVITSDFGGHYVVAYDGKIQDPLQGPDRVISDAQLWFLLKEKQIIFISPR